MNNDEVLKLEKKLAETQALLMEVSVAGEECEFDDVTQYVMPIETYQAVSDFALDQSNTEEVRTELTKREAAARQQGFEEGKQAGRDEVLTELSESPPMMLSEIYAYNNGVIRRPLPPVTKE